jgi:hypothetical protein
MSPFDYEYAKRDANVCGSEMIAEVQMTCRGRMPILGPPQLWAQANGIAVSGLPTTRELSPDSSNRNEGCGHFLL